MNFFRKTNSNSITPEQNKQTEILYSNIFETILANKEPFSYQTGLKHTLLTKRGRVHSSAEYLDVMYNNISYLCEMNTLLSDYISTIFEKKNFPTENSKNSTINDYQIRTKQKLESLYSNQKKLYDDKYPTIQAKIEAVDFDYCYWMTLNGILIDFLGVLSVQTNLPILGDLLKNSTENNVSLINKYSVFHTNFLLQNIAFTGQQP
ncbi:hypothetical protein [Trichococcus ilyis]|uniref:Uncharacterized protein n=1 Tax=Trichococcus ilyis TaxID=640938 RepID=A0A143Z7G0_9LACT|nr:hypothetical protein [Trichococcus ilyis]CZR09433.1 Hypothetical protein TR210_2722 [Trichococcus ilyis]SEJ96427.1 hypothetical protein SAMN05216375_14813 [Trichococcus ilyis]